MSGEMPDAGTYSRARQRKALEDRVAALEARLLATGDDGIDGCERCADWPDRLEGVLMEREAANEITLRDRFALALVCNMAATQSAEWYWRKADLIMSARGES